MKKVVIVLLIAILIVSSAVGFMFWRGKRREISSNEENYKVENYGNRGNISQVEKIKFLSKNDEYLVGMMGLPLCTELTEFSDDDMIRFALNVAAERYSDFLTSRVNADGSHSYLIQESIVNKITDEFFGIKEVTFDKTTNEYYSKSNKAFLLEDIPEKTLYYYPVNMEKNGENENVEIIVDAIFISDSQDQETIESAKYEGKYREEAIDSTVVFVFSSDGKLVAYKYLLEQ